MKTRRIKAFGIAIGAFVALSIFASCASGPTASQSGKEPRFFWTLKAPSGATLSIQGTIHLGADELYPLKQPVLDAMAQSDLVYAELSPSALKDVQSLVVERMAKSVLEPSKALDTLLSADERSQIESIMGKEMWRRLLPFQPWVSSIVLESYAAAGMGLDEARGVDMVLYSVAGELGKEVLGLESASFQLDVLAGPSLSTQLSVLKDSLRELRDEPSALSKLYAAYRDNNQKAFARLMEDSEARSRLYSSDLGAYYDSLIIQRNQAWLKLLVAQAEKGKDIFLFAGAAHFVGPDNLIDMLKKLGYKLQ